MLPTGGEVCLCLPLKKIYYGRLNTSALLTKLLGGWLAGRLTGKLACQLFGCYCFFFFFHQNFDNHITMQFSASAVGTNNI